MRSERVRVSATTDEAALAQAARRLGWRVYATNHPAAALSVEQAVAAYRSEYLIEQGFGRLKGHSLSLTPLFLQYDHRVVGLVSLLSIALRVWCWFNSSCGAIFTQKAQRSQASIRGSQGRQTAQPTTEMLLARVSCVTLSRIRLHGKTYDHMTPSECSAHSVSSKLLEMPPDIYDGIVSRFSKNRFSFARNVSQNSELFRQFNRQFTDSLNKGITKQCAHSRRTRMVNNPAYQANAFLAKSLKKLSKDKFAHMSSFWGGNTSIVPIIMSKSKQSVFRMLQKDALQTP